MDVALVQADFVVVKAGLQAGERVVVSDLVPAIEGMALDPVIDTETLDLLLRQSTSGGKQ